MRKLDPSQIKIVEGLPPRATKQDRIAVDVEIYNMVKGKLHRPTVQFASLQCTFDGKTVYIIEDEKQVPAFLKRIEPGCWIFHNAKFDIFHLRRWATIPKRERLWDTMLIEKIMYSGYYESFTLADLVRRYLDTYLEKATREEFENHTGKMTRSQLEYAALDAVATWMVYQAQKTIIDDDDLYVWTDIDLPFMWVILAMPGLTLDTKAWEKLAVENRTKADAIAAKYPDINLSSWQQVQKKLHKIGFTKIESTKEDFLTPLLEKDKTGFVHDLLEYRGRSKAASTYGMNWMGYVEEDGCIYSDFILNGAATGRLSSREPNVENIPIRETPEYRKCVVAKKGHALIDADWSAQEPRISTHLSGDKKMLKIFQAKKDVYIESAWLMFRKKIDKKDPFRKPMKATVLGASYGLTEFGMEKKYQIPKKDGRHYLDVFFETFDGMREWKEKQQKIKTYVTTIYGRKYWLNNYQRGSENNALNSPVQGSASDAMKIAGYRFMCEWGWTDTNSPIVNFIHDEILLEVPKAKVDKAVKLLRKVMIEVAEEMHPGIPADVEIGTGQTWHDAHG